MRVSKGGEPGEHNLSLENRREAISLARAIGVSFSAGKLVLCALTETMWPLDIAMYEDDLRQVNTKLNPPSLELNAHLEHLISAEPQAQATIAKTEI